MDNASLCQLIREALHSPEKAEALALAIDYLPEIKRYLNKDGWLPYYEQALPKTVKDVKQNISKFPQMKGLNLEDSDCHDPTNAANIRKHFISWVMVILKRDCHDIKRCRFSNHYSIDKIINKRGDIFPDWRIGGIEASIEDELIKICGQLRQYIQLDRDEQLKTCYARNRPDINCQSLLELRFLNQPPLTLKDIAQRFQVTIPVIESRLKRNCFPLVRDIALRLGYKIG